MFPRCASGLTALMLAAGVMAAAAEQPAGAAQPEPAAEKPLEKPVLIVYPLVSEFDDGKLGIRARECLRGHALRGGKLTCFDPLTEEEQLGDFRPAVGTEVEKVADHAREKFKAGYAVWGEVKRDGKGYKLRFLGAAVEPEKKVGTKGARLVADETYDCANVHMIPQRAETFLAKLLAGDRRQLERQYGEATKVLEELAVNGDFSAEAPEKLWPAGWSLVRPDLKAQVSWIQRPGGAKDDRCLTYTLTTKTADNEGLAMASEYLPVKEGAYYQASVEILTEKPTVIFWVKGYTEVNGEKRETYRHQVKFYPEKKGEWERLTTRPFRPRQPWQKVESIRIVLYAYHPAGKVSFDNVWLRRVEVTGDKEPDPAFVKEGGGDRLK
jgi:hypothetical protein